MHEPISRWSHQAAAAAFLSLAIVVPALADPIIPSTDVHVIGLRHGVPSTVGTDMGFLGPGNPAFFLDYTTSTGFEERSIMEFDLDTLVGPEGFLNLYLIGGGDSGGLFFDSALVPPGYRTGVTEPLRVEVYGYSGDGVLDLADATSGALLTSFLVDRTGAFNIDLTLFLASLRTSGDRWLGLNLRVVADPRYDSEELAFYRPPTFGESRSVTPPPIKFPVPEPSTAVLVTVALLSERLRRRGWFRRHRRAQG